MTFENKESGRSSFRREEGKNPAIRSPNRIGFGVHGFRKPTTKSGKRVVSPRSIEYRLLGGAVGANGTRRRRKSTSSVRTVSTSNSYKCPIPNDRELVFVFVFFFRLRGQPTIITVLDYRVAERDDVHTNTRDLIMCAHTTGLGNGAMTTIPNHRFRAHVISRTVTRTSKYDMIRKYTYIYIYIYVFPTSYSNPQRV